jgi:hypothetical protein
MPTYPSTFIHCPYCEAQVQASVLGEKEYPPYEDSEPTKYQFVACSKCGTAMVGHCEWEQDDEGGRGWGKLTRSWPQVDQQLHHNIPRIVRRSLEEARRCHSAKAFTACAVMVGRAIEGMCKDKVKAKYLGEGLKKLKAQGIIDEKLYKWGEALRNERNIGAHAGTESVSWQDARDVLDFSYAMAEYVYVLDEKYKEYVARKSPPAA